MSCVISYRVPGSGMTLDMEQVGAHMRASQQEKLFRHVAQWITEDDIQRVMDALAEQVKTSRAESAVRIARGEWPVPRPVSRATLNRFIKAMPKNALSVCNIPKFIEDEKE